MLNVHLFDSNGKRDTEKYHTLNVFSGLQNKCMSSIFVYMLLFLIVFVTLS